MAIASGTEPGQRGITTYAPTATNAAKPMAAQYLFFMRRTPERTDWRESVAQYPSAPFRQDERNAVVVPAAADTAKSCPTKVADSPLRCVSLGEHRSLTRRKRLGAHSSDRQAPGRAPKTLRV